MTLANITRRSRDGRAMLKTWQERQGRNLDCDKNANMVDALDALLYAAADQGLDPRDAVRIALDHFTAERPDALQVFDEIRCGEMGLDPFAVRNGWVFWTPGGKDPLGDLPGMPVDGNGCPARGFYFTVFVGEEDRAVQGPFPTLKAAETERARIAKEGLAGA